MAVTAASAEARAGEPCPLPPPFPVSTPLLHFPITWTASRLSLLLLRRSLRSARARNSTFALRSVSCGRFFPSSFFPLTFQNKLKRRTHTRTRAPQKKGFRLSCIFFFSNSRKGRKSLCRARAPREERVRVQKVEILCFSSSILALVLLLVLFFALGFPDGTVRGRCR
jgi:hypothetical protein